MAGDRATPHVSSSPFTALFGHRDAAHAQVRTCDGFRMPAPLAKFATRTMAGGPAFANHQRRKPRKLGTAYLGPALAEPLERKMPSQAHANTDILQFESAQ